ncbi:hypothetical protein J6590_068567 [Homalodisca vitripennis]|nr:hypothetical protein J6590_068567 [Homalodisca vitripennis]
MEFFFSDFLKLARTVPVHKKDDHQVLSSYRPISVIPALTKILEYVLKNHLIAWVQDESINYNSYYLIGRTDIEGFADEESMALTHCDLRGPLLLFADGITQNSYRKNLLVLERDDDEVLRQAKQWFGIYS